MDETEGQTPVEGSEAAVEAEAAPEGRPEDSSPWETVGEDAPNAWEGMREGIDLMGRGELAPPAAPEPEEVSEPDEGPPEGESEPRAEQTSDTEPEADEEAGSHDRFKAVSADGEETSVELEDGTEIRFKAAGEEHAVTSLDELVDFAQKGVDYQQKTEELASERREIRSQLENLESQFETEVEKANRIIEAILTDEEAFAHYREQLDKLKDPDVREGLEAKRKLQEREEEDKKREEQQREEVVQKFQEALDSEIESNLEDFELLRPQDEPLVKQYFMGLQRQQYQEIVGDYLNAAEDQGWTEDEAKRAAWTDSAAVLTEENLRAVMKSLNEEIRDRLGSDGTRNGGSGEEAGTGEEDIEGHNSYTREKLKQKERGSGLRSGGAPPGGGDDMPELDRREGEDVFKARVRQMKETLGTAR